MNKFILGTKKAMTQVFAEDGQVYPATIVVAAPSTVIGTRSKAKDGYSAVQLGFGTQKEHRVSKPVKGQTKELGLFKVFKEFRDFTDADPILKRGDKVDVSVFKSGDIVEVSSVSKGKGFQGVVKRHGFHGGPRTHGQKHSEREPGSISGGVREGGRVQKNMRMGGRMGSDRITIKNLTIVKVDPATNELYISGAIAGRRGTLIEIRG